MLLNYLFLNLFRFLRFVWYKMVYLMELHYSECWVTVMGTRVMSVGIHCYDETSR